MASLCCCIDTTTQCCGNLRFTPITATTCILQVYECGLQLWFVVRKDFINKCPNMYGNMNVHLCVCCRSSGCSVWGVPAYPEQYPAPWEPPAALSGAETSERAKDKGVGCRLEPLITYSFHLIQESPPTPSLCMYRSVPFGTHWGVGGWEEARGV